MNRGTARASKRTREAFHIASFSSGTTDAPAEEEFTPTSASTSETSSDASSRNAIYDLSDTVCIIYTYLEQRDQGSLRQTCLTAAERFDQTVDMGDVPAVGSMDIAVWESRRQTAYDRDEEWPGSNIGSRYRWQWFPVARRLLYSSKRSIEVLQVNVDAIALNPTYRTEWGIEMTSNGTAVASDNFLANLDALCRVFFQESKLLQVVERFFLYDCRQLLAVDFHGLGALTTVGHRCLCGCPSLTTIGFEGLAALSTVEDYWLDECTSLKKISFAGLGALTTVGSCWLEGCTSLTSIRFEGLAALTTVGSWWLEGCTSLATIRFEGLGALSTIGEWWLEGCSSLTTISFEGLGALSTVGPSWLEGCTSVRGRWFFECTTLTRLSYDSLSSPTFLQQLKDLNISSEVTRVTSRELARLRKL